MTVVSLVFDAASFCKCNRWVEDPELTAADRSVLIGPGAPLAPLERAQNLKMGGAHRHAVTA
jgi:hypothetical protein